MKASSPECCGKNGFDIKVRVSQARKYYIIVNILFKFIYIIIRIPLSISILLLKIIHPFPITHFHLHGYTRK